ncbi:hypothetical protein LTS08_007129 [Lithohypha guttulata]|uniref:Uncharacterized protein n=1 Tax=Lithohypha guttulata TaxID=1690604 RepID=A0AAN7YBF3_9EURO|nr:hypothetical protein LTR05_003883 [Lithohypha guttulata]KAK5097108.1 hypothetical protein LTS08_007129 [Lithohypha guttulata]
MTGTGTGQQHAEATSHNNNAIISNSSWTLVPTPDDPKLGSTPSKTVQKVLKADLSDVAQIGSQFEESLTREPQKLMTNHGKISTCLSLSEYVCSDSRTG